ncbi:MAG TPA: hypothetical protein VMV15_13910 [Candidatus Binataceae bacterium]|nr:hypothetical protein [Candidatus Binataceae bacterium]
MNEILEIVRTQAAPYGLNLIAAIPAARYAATGAAAQSSLRAAHPRARSIVLLGNGGGGLWRALEAHATAHPGWWRRDHPLDDFTREVVERMMLPALEAHGLEAIAAYPFLADPYMFNFIELGRLAGLGGPSILGVLVHPVYGPWIAFRAAILLDADLDSPGAAAGFDPCPSCTVRSCIPACPVGAVTPASGWDVPRCARHRVEVETDCAARCHARVGCVLGPNHRYPDEELAYHQRRSLPAMRSYYEAGAGQTKREESE